MKKLLITVLTLSALSISACKKDKADETATGGSATVTAGNYGFDGNSSLGKFSSTKAGITQVSAGGITTFSVTAIKDGSNESITIILLKPAALGKVQFGPSLSNGGIIISKDYTKAADGTLNYSTDNSGAMQGGGEVNFTKVDGSNVEGTFYAVAYNNARKEAFAEQGTFKGTIK
jgi:hypothetical protein